MSDTLLSELLSAETVVWQALVDGDAAADAAALSGDFLGVYPDGCAGKADHVGQLANGPTVEIFALSEATARAIGPDHGLLSYHARFRRAGRNADEAMYVSSLWRRENDGWVNLFSQDTPAA